MKKFSFSLLGISIFSTCMLQAQTPVRQLDKSNMRDGEHVEYCTQHKHMAEAMKDPAFAAQYRAAQQQLADEAAQKSKEPSGTTKATVYTIPVVFHVLHNGGVENISKEQIEDAVAILNRDFRLLNADAATVQTPFQGMPSDIEIEFALARKAPNGQCFSGITRTKTTLTFDGSNGQAQVNAVVNGNDVFQGVWDHKKYLNIYVCDEIDGAAGYTFNPMGGTTASATNMYYNGIFVLHNYTGSIGTSSNFTSRTLTHEVGHWLNLEHTWGPNNSPGNAASCGDDDGVQDTPMCTGLTSCNLNANTCDDTNDPNGYSSWTTNVIDNAENYMDYSYCSKMFTPGQRTRMRNAAASSVSGRNQLWTTTNLDFTGATNPLTLCSAKFTAPKTVVCAGETIQFKDQSFNAVSGWNWTFAGGSPANSSSQNPSVTYTTPGTYTVTLQATDGSSNDTETITNYITVLPAGEETLPFYEGFETETNLSTSSRWFIENTGGNAWEVTNTAAHSGVKSAKLSNFGQAADQLDELISKTIDLSNVDTVTLSFRYAYRKRTSTSNDILRVYLTNNCASSWEVRRNLSATTMSGSTTASTAWTPTANDWVTVHMTNVTSQYWVENFRFKFQFESGGGNNVYLDDINIYESLPSDTPVIVGLDEETVNGINLYPNPADDEVSVTFNAGSAQDVWVSVTDVTGKVIERHLIHGKTGANLVALNTTAYANGVYFVNLLSGNTNQTLQFVIK